MQHEPLDVPPVSEFQSDTESPTDAVVRKTPWWVISVGLHAAAALVVAMFWVITAQAKHEVIVGSIPKPPPNPPKFVEPERDPRDKQLDIPEREEVVQKKTPIDEVTQTEDEKEFENSQGDLDEAISDDPFKNKNTYASIGNLGGVGGKIGSRDKGGKINAVRTGGGGRHTEDAVLEALKWLSRHQDPDGSWNVADFTKQCSSTCAPNPGHHDFDAGVTGLSILAFLGAGHSHLSKEIHDGISFGDVVRKGLQWMLMHQDPEGCIGSRNAQKYMYNHTICALALSEAYGLTGSKLFKEQAQRSIDFIIAAQNPGKAWRYSTKCGDNDSSVTGWAVMALKSAEISGLAFPRTGYDGTRHWYGEASEKAYGRVGYTHRGTGKVFVPGMNEQFDHHEALTAIGVMARIFMDKNARDPYVVNGANLLLNDLPEWNGNSVDFYYWYYASLALFQYDGPEGSKWSKWNQPMVNALVKNQNTKSTGCRRGSWEPVGRWCGEGGRVYATAINALTLEVYYRYVNVFGKRG